MKVCDLDIRHIHVHHVHEWERLRGFGKEEKDGTEEEEEGILTTETYGREPKVLKEVLADLKKLRLRLDKV